MLHGLEALSDRLREAFGITRLLVDDALWTITGIDRNGAFAFRYAATALTVREGARRIRNSAPFAGGWIELQDAASQSVVEDLPTATRILDYCAGGGGKALALAARKEAVVFAHDIDAERMVDLPLRAERARVAVELLDTLGIEKQAPFDLVLCDAPCSGSGAWRRAPEGKWRLTPERLQELTQVQDAILDQACRMVVPKATLAFATCSVLREENEARVESFLARHPGWTCVHQRRYDVCPDGDGFFAAHLRSD